MLSAKFPSLQHCSTHSVTEKAVARVIINGYLQIINYFMEQYNPNDYFYYSHRKLDVEINFQQIIKETENRLRAMFKGKHFRIFR